MYGVTFIQTASVVSGLVDWLIPIAMILCGLALIKKACNKAVKIIGTLFSAVGFFLLMWTIAWFVIALIFI